MKNTVLFSVKNSIARGLPSFRNSRATKVAVLSSHALLAALALGIVGSQGCDTSLNNAQTDNTEKSTAQVTIKNEFPEGKFTLVSVSYLGHRWDEVIGPGEISSSAEIEPGLGYAYALGVFGYTGREDDSKPIVLKTKTEWETVGGSSFEIVFSFPTHLGKC